MNVLKKYYKTILILISVAILLLFVLFLFFYKGDGYFKFFNTVYYLNENIKSPDQDNFRVVKKGFARDNVWAYYKGFKFSKGNPSEFKIINDSYCVDARNAYIYFPGRRILRIPNSDAKTFKALDREGYSMDLEKAFYFDGDNFHFMFSEGFEFIDDIDEYNARDIFRYYKDGEIVKFTDEWVEHVQKVSDEQKMRQNEKIYKNNWRQRKELNDVYAEKIFDKGQFFINGIWDFFPVYNFKCASTVEEALLDPFKFFREFYININSRQIEVNERFVEGDFSTDSFLWDGINFQLDSNKYNIIDGCFYRDGEKVFDYNLLVMRALGYFGKRYDLADRKEFDDNFRGSLNELSRFEEGEYLYIYLKGSNGRTGFASGPYLKINLKTDKIEGGNINEEYVKYMKLSLDRKEAIVTDIEMISDESVQQTKRGKIKLFLYDFIEGKRVREIYEISEDKTILYEGMGYNMIEDSIVWIDDYRIQLTLYGKSGIGEAECLTSTNETGEIVFTECKNSNNPMVINVSGQNVINSFNLDDWQEYGNEKYGFSFKYPRDWYSEDSSEDFNGLHIGFYPEGKERGYEYTGDIVLSVSENKVKNDILDYLDSSYSTTKFRKEKTDSGNDMYIAYNVPGFIDSDKAIVNCNEYFVLLSTPFALGREYFEVMAKTIKCN